MTTLSIQPPFPIFSDRDGQPLENGYIWVGTANLNPITNPVAVYWDAGLTQPAALPVRTINGYPANSGTPGRLYISNNFSITVQDANGSLVYSAPAVTDRYNDVVVTGVDSSEVSFLQAGTGAVTRTAQSKMRDTISVFDFMTAAQIAAVQTNNYSVVTGAEITTACQAALTAASGRTLLFPAGTYVITSTLTYQPAAYVSAFGPGVRVIGDGVGSTIFDNRVNGPMISMTTGSTGGTFLGALGAVLEGFKITRTTSTTNGVGLYMTAAYNATVRNVHIIGMSLHGIQIPCILGDNDGSNMVRLDHIRIENCAGWGIKAEGDPGFNETSFMYLQHVFIQACGTTSAAYQPPSGGMSWKGQILTLQQCAFTLNENCALWVPGQAGLGQTIDLQDTAFENNKARSFFCRGITQFKARNIQFYNNNSYISTVACEFEAGTYLVRQIDIDGVVVRATNLNNPYTAFKISGANAELNTCRVRNVNWDNFDYTGQTRFDGWQFDAIPTDQYILQVPSGTEIYLRPNQTIGKGNKVPLRLRGGGGGTPSTSGEWIANRLTNTGLFLNPAAFAATTRYYVYLYDNNGTPTLEADSAASPVTDSTHGYAVKSGDATRYYVGSVVGGAVGGTVATTASGWLNPMQIPGTQGGVPVFIWADSSGRLRIANTAPTADTSGTVVGTQV